MCIGNSDYLREFKALATTVEQLGGELGVEANHIREQLANDEAIAYANNLSQVEQVCAHNAVREGFVAVGCLNTRQSVQNSICDGKPPAQRP